MFNTNFFSLFSSVKIYAATRIFFLFSLSLFSWDDERFFRSSIVKNENETEKGTERRRRVWKTWSNTEIFTHKYQRACRIMPNIKSSRLLGLFLWCCRSNDLCWRRKLWMYLWLPILILVSMRRRKKKKNFQLTFVITLFIKLCARMCVENFQFSQGSQHCWCWEGELDCVTWETWLCSYACTRVGFL